MITEKVTKLDAARRQIDESIRMFFECRDTIATHMVASAAAQILSDLGKGGFQGWTRNPSIVKPGRWKEWRAAITKFERFFKHAETDAGDICDFHPESTPFSIIESVEMLRVMTGKFSWEGMIFSIWFSMKYPEVLQESEFKKAITEKAAILPCDINDLSVFAELLKMRTSVPQSVLDGLLV
jgi:hypothetical protein